LHPNGRLVVTTGSSAVLAVGSELWQNPGQGGAMRVADIIRQKGDGVGTLPPGATIADAVAALRTLGVGAVVVSDDDVTVEGILSERDIVRRLDVDGAEVLDLEVGDLMTTDVVTCGLDATLADLMSVMTDRRIRHIPVVEDGRLGGLVSIGDVVKGRLEELEEERRHLEDYITRG
jgi:CBS domain-containing protein